MQGGRAFNRPNLTTREIDSLREFQHGTFDSQIGGFQTIQDYLRTGEVPGHLTAGQINQFTRAIGSAIDKSTIRENHIVYRGVSDLRAGTGIGSLKDIKPGMTFTDNGWVFAKLPLQILQIKHKC